MASPTTRAATTNDPLALPSVDGRGAWARRRRDLIRELSAELGHKPSTRDRALISNCAALIVRSEQLQARIVNGEHVDNDELVRLGNILQRALASLRSKPDKSDGNALSAYIARSKAVA